MPAFCEAGQDADTLSFEVLGCNKDQAADYENDRYGKEDIDNYR
jgi:hypothetical protein